MLRRMKDMIGFKLLSQGEEFGKVKDIYFDSADWVVRYYVVETGNWLNSRRVLIPPNVVQQPDWEKKHFPVPLTREQIKDSPPMDAHRPVSRRHELDLHNYFGWQPYWVRMGDMVPAAAGMAPGIEPEATAWSPEETENVPEEDVNLHSAQSIFGYAVRALDGDLGHVGDFLVDPTCRIRYLVADTRNWLPGRKVLLSAQWVGGINWETADISVDLTREDIRHSPAWDPSIPPDRNYEERLYNHYGRPMYW